ncbi:THO complex subunit 5 homolog isoform X2 [Ptychodera flava]|uniref:THO complex subunit 5 homolog isoform X2 n=1 Tax=Ptychodera flava TaxID=63121 RepID=UPI00396A379F
MSSTAGPAMKKRRRTARPLSDVSSSSKDIKKGKLSHEPQEPAYSEEKEVDQRDPQKDQELFSRACGEIKRLMKDIYDMKMSGSQDRNTEVMEKRIQASLNFVNLKKLNRLSHIRCKKAKDATHDAKMKVDSFHLQLQNLLYEVMHLQKEIRKCLEFDSKDEDIDLVDEEEFYQEAPPEISKPDVTKTDPHQQRLARLDWELEQRKQLAEKCKESQNKKDQISKKIRTKREYLDSLQPKLQDVLQATQPLKMLSMPFEQTRMQHKKAKHLPRPLYVLYVQANAYHEACDTDISINIDGDIESAIAEESNSSAVEYDSDSDEEAATDSKRRRRSTVDVLTVKRKRILNKHPLTVVMTIKCTDGSVLVLTFGYLMVLQIVTVSLKLSPSSDSTVTTVTGGELLSHNSLLSCLFPGDYGNDTPNPANQYQLNKLGMDTFSAYISKVGHPYIWVQRLAGLEFLEHDEEQETPKAKSATSATHMEATTTALRRRVVSRLALQKQLASLERNTIPVPSDSQRLFPAKLDARFTSWTSLPFDDYTALPYTEDIQEAELISEADMFFLSTFERKSAKLNAAIVVHPDYPASSPLFSLLLSWRGEHHARNNEAIRMMESEVNVHYQELMETGSPDFLLTNQLQRLLMCFDVYLEAQSATASLAAPLEFAKEKVMPRMARGPHRAKPYKYNPNHGFFSHR